MYIIYEDFEFVESYNGSQIWSNKDGIFKIKKKNFWRNYKFDNRYSENIKDARVEIDARIFAKCMIM